jgi:hypothetical protein
MNYESKRITLSFPAVERLMQAYGLPEDLPSQTLAGYIERLIYECLCKHPVSPTPVVAKTEPIVPPATSDTKPNLSKLSAMASKFKVTS